MASSGTRARRSVAEKRRIVELTLEPGASVARVAQAEGVNANQVFAWRRLYREGKLNGGEMPPTALLPVVVSHRNEVEQAQPEEQPQSVACGSINIEFPGRALISVESGADARLLRTVLTTLASIDRLQGDPEESLRK
jgi:transposase